MSSYPNRCQHIKVNGTQCGSPALRRNKFCFFHKKWHEQRILVNAGHARRARAIDLPVLEDANSIQVALMQIMRMTMGGQLDTKQAGLLLYALQTASFNLRHTNFEPFMHNVILDLGTLPTACLATRKSGATRISKKKWRKRTMIRNKTRPISPASQTKQLLSPRVLTAKHRGGQTWL